MSDARASKERVVTGCEWEADTDGVWNTTCGKSFVLNDGGPIENDMRFCCYCGLALDQLPFEEVYCDHGVLVGEGCDGCDGEDDE